MRLDPVIDKELTPRILDFAGKSQAGTLCHSNRRTISWPDRRVDIVPGTDSLSNRSCHCFCRKASSPIVRVNDVAELKLRLAWEEPTKAYHSSARPIFDCPHTDSMSASICDPPLEPCFCALASMLTPRDVGRRHLMCQNSEHRFEIDFHQSTEEQSFGHYWRQSRTGGDGFNHCQSAERTGVQLLAPEGAQRPTSSSGATPVRSAALRSREVGVEESGQTALLPSRGGRLSR